MNMFRYDQKSAIAECWAPVSELPRIRDLLDKESVLKKTIIYIIILYLYFNISKNYIEKK